MDAKRYKKRLNKFSRHYAYNIHNNYNVSRFARLCMRYFDIARFIVDINKGAKGFETTLFEVFTNKRGDVIHYI